MTMMAEINMPDGEIKFNCNMYINQQDASWLVYIHIARWCTGHTISKFNCLSTYIIIIIQNTVLPFSLGVTNQNFWDFRLFTFDFKCWNCPSAWCASAANAINSDTEIFNGHSVSVNMIG